MVDAVVRLFVSTARTFVSNGLGYLPDIISCEVTEERNGAFEFKMEYPVTGRLFSEIMTRRILVSKSNPFSNPQPFRIYEITKPIKGKVTIYAEHISYDLSGIPINPFEATNVITALQGLKENAMIECPFNFMTDKTTQANYLVPFPTNIRSELGGVEGSILDVYRGEYEFDGYNVNLWNNRGMDRGVTIRYGKNMTDLEQDENISNLFTGVLPYWYSEMEDTGGYVQGNIVNCPGSYNFQKIMVLDCSYDFQEKPTVENLTSFAENYISSNDLGIPKLSIEVSFIDLGSSEEYQNVAALTTVHLCDTVTVEYPELGVKATGKCVKTKYNVIEDRYSSVQIGDAKPTLADTLASNNDKLAEDFEKKMLSNTGTTKEEFEKKLNETYTELIGDITNLGEFTITSDGQIRSELEAADKDLKLLIAQTAEREATAREEAIANATKRITGNLGGYVILHSSTNADYPDEILIMDTDNINTAKQVWRWNKAGLGYSSKGYNGPFGLAMTQDGAIVADYIKTGALNAALITTGHMSASIIQGGTLILGGKNNGNGNFILRDNSNNVIGLMSNAGFSLYKGTIQGPSVIIGGTNNEDGTLTVTAADESIIGSWDNSGLTVRKGTIQGPSIYLGGADNGDGTITVLNSENIIDGTWDSNGILIRESQLGVYGAYVDLFGVPNKSIGIFLGSDWEIHVAEQKVYDQGLLVDNGILSGFGTFTSLQWFQLGHRNADTGIIDVYYSMNNWANLDGLTTFEERHLLNGDVRLIDGSLYFGDIQGRSSSPSIWRRDYTDFAICANNTKFKITDGPLEAFSPIEASAFNINSSRRYKKNIRELTEEEAKKILDVESVVFDYINERQGSDKPGVIAEDTYEVIPSVVTLDRENRPDSVDYSKFVPYLIKMIQIQEKRIDELARK